MPGVADQVQAVDVLVSALLLHHEDPVAQREHVVEVRDGEVGVVQVVPGEVHERSLAAGGLAFGM